MTLTDRFRGCLLGLAVGDAVGTTLEFRPPGTFEPITDMVGGGPFRLRPGQWTDDTSMALCLAASLVERGGFDAADQMDRYVRWWKQGYVSSTGRCFDIGNTVRSALERFLETRDPWAGSTDPHAAGNGSIMRLAPVAMFYHPDLATVVEHAANSSRTTHATPECVDACRFLGSLLHRAFSGAPKDEVLFGAPDFDGTPKVRALAQGAYRGRARTQIRGTGYVIDSLEAALWCFWTTETFEAAILAAANLGDDADTTAAVTGQVAGAFYDVAAIPPSWRERVSEATLITRLADQLARNGDVSPRPSAATKRA